MGEYVDAALALGDFCDEREAVVANRIADRDIEIGEFAGLGKGGGGPLRDWQAEERLRASHRAPRQG